MNVNLIGLIAGAVFGWAIPEYFPHRKENDYIQPLLAISGGLLLGTMLAQNSAAQGTITIGRPRLPAGPMA
jgi:hypothetical protein